MFSYKKSRVAQLQPYGYAKQVAFSKLCLDNMSSNSCFSYPIDSSDVCVFHVLVVASA